MASRKSRAKERREERERMRRRNRQLTLAGGIGAVVIIVAILFIAASATPTEAPIPADLGDIYDDLDRSTTAEGFPLLGDPDAPVTVRDISSFSCTPCANFHRSVFPSIVERVRTGNVNLVFVPYHILGSVPNSEGAARTAMCAAEQRRFWEMHDLLFDWHLQFVNTAFQSNRLTAAAEGLGLNMNLFNQCFNSGEVSAILQAGIATDISGTPTIQVNGQTLPDVSMETVMNAIDAAVQAAGPREVEPEPTEEVMATEEADMTEEPDATEEADMTEEPDATEEADMTEEPDATEEADMTEEPDATEEADMTEEPDATEEATD